MTFQKLIASLEQGESITFERFDEVIIPSMNNLVEIRIRKNKNMKRYGIAQKVSIEALTEANCEFLLPEIEAGLKKIREKAL